MSLQTIWTVAEASNLALKEGLIEKSPQNFSSIRRYSPENNLESTSDKENSAENRDFNPSNNGASNSNSKQQSKTPTQRQNNPHVKATRDTC